jgi:ribosomal-protein-alanine N-acetyltransferase
VSVRIIDLPLPVMLALRDGDVTTAERMVGLPIPAEFAAQTDIWNFMVTLLDGRPENATWTMHALVRGDEIVGNAGFKGAPDEHGEIELGYRILTDHRRQGLALAAAHLMLARAEHEPSVTRVLATISPDNAASIGVITKAGFTPDGDRIHPRWGRQLRFLKATA